MPAKTQYSLMALLGMGLVGTGVGLLGMIVWTLTRPPVAAPAPPASALIVGGCMTPGHVTPDPIQLITHDQDIEWELADSSGATEFLVKQKDPRWAWKPGRAFAGRKGPAAPATGPGSTRNPGAKGRYDYSVLLTCPSGTNLTIDPTIIIPPK